MMKGTIISIATENTCVCISSGSDDDNAALPNELQNFENIIDLSLGNIDKNTSNHKNVW